LPGGYQPKVIRIPTLSAILKISPLVFEEGLNFSVRPTKVEYKAVFLSLKY
jgi:hypothetical protein